MAGAIATCAVDQVQVLSFFGQQNVLPPSQAETKCLLKIRFLFSTKKIVPIYSVLQVFFCRPLKRPHSVHQLHNRMVDILTGISRIWPLPWVWTLERCRYAPGPFPKIPNSIV